jgi:hypothetical protein
MSQQIKHKSKHPKFDKLCQIIVKGCEIILVLLGITLCIIITIILIEHDIIIW